MTEALVRESWWKRNWKWAVPVGGCLTLIVMFLLFIGSIVYGVSSAFKESTPYKEAKSKAEQHPVVLEYIGKPIATNGIMTGEISVSNDNGKANITMPVKGPKGVGHIAVVGTKTNGVWSYSSMTVTIKDPEQTIDLLKD